MTLDLPATGLRSPGFDIAVRRAGRVAIVAVEGECDVARADSLRTTLEAALEADGEALVVDLTRVELFDSASLGALALASEKARRLGRPLVTVASAPLVRRPFELTGLGPTLGLVESLGEAFARLEPEARDTDER